MLKQKWQLSPLTTCVALACSAIFFGLQMLGEKATWGQTAAFGYFPDLFIWMGKPWVLLTSVFVHLEPWHLLFNVYWLWILGGPIERDIGSLRWALFFIVSAWVSSAAQLASGDTGIGLSGVGYALFGFAWVGRDKLRNAGPIVHEGTVNLFLVWLVACIIATKMGWMNVGNEAHFGGLVFGAAVAGASFKKPRALLCATTILLLAASFIPLFYCPLSEDWTFLEGTRAHLKEDYPTAKYWYHRSLALGGDKARTWENLAHVAMAQHDEAALKEAVTELRREDPQAASHIETLSHLQKELGQSGTTGP